MAAAQQAVALSHDEAVAVDEAMQTGLKLQARGLTNDAERLYAGVLKLVPHHFDALHLLGVVRYQQGAYAEALSLIDNALEFNGRSADALNNHARILLQVGRTNDAFASLNRALAVDPDHALALINRASIHLERGEFAAAVADADRALERDPDNALAWSKRAAALAALGHADRAINAYGRALAIDPEMLEALNNRAALLGQVGRSAEALVDLDRLLARHPDVFEVLMNRGNTLLELNREQEAITSYQRAFAAARHPTARYLEGLAQLRLGHLARGWEYYEFRWHSQGFENSKRNYPSPVWSGRKLAGRLLVSGEQGLGEQILFAGMLSEIRTLVQAMTVEVEPRLIPLYARSFPDIDFVPLQKELHAGPADAHIAIGSIAQYLRRDFRAFPARNDGYLRADAQRTAQLRERLSDGRLVIGLSWHCRNPRYAATKSARLADFAALLRLPGCRFVDLQYGDTAADRQIAELELGVRIERLPDIDNTNDLDGLAALIGACDLVVTVSNTTAHLAGALGRKTDVLVPSGRGRLWHWFSGRNDSPWYPHLRLWRQQPGQPWSDVMAKVGAALGGRSQ
jgi:tetratricopeptide (TPR) repeat protein